MTAIKAKARTKIAAIEKKARLKWKLIKNKLKVYIAANNIATTVTAITATKAMLPLKRIIAEDNDIIDKVLLKITNISLRFADLLEKEIVRIFHNKFKVINLYYLCYM